MAATGACRAEVLSEGGKMDNVRNFVKNLYFILIQIYFSQLKYITQHVFFKLKKRFCLRSVDAAWSNVEF